MDDTHICPYCDHLVEHDMDPIIEFPCWHRAHASCFFQLLNNATHSLAEQNHVCQMCETSIFEPVEEDEEEEEEIEEDQNEIVEGPEQEEVPSDNASLTYYERLRKRFDENKDMQKDVKAYIKAKQACSSKRKTLQKFTGEKKGEIKHSVESLREQLASLLRVQRKSIVQSQAYKSYNGAYLRVSMLRARIAKKYNIDMDSLRRAIQEKKGFRRWTRDFRWRDNPSYILRRAFYRRYIRC